jgi:hypothetical protein
MRHIAIGAWPFAHLAHVDAGAHPREVGLFAMHLLEPQREQDRGAGSLEGQKAAVSGPVDDAAARLRRQPPHVRPMPSDQRADGLIAALRLQRGRVRQVGKDQREDARDTSRVSHGGRLEACACLVAPSRGNESQFGKVGPVACGVAREQLHA